MYDSKLVKCKHKSFARLANRYKPLQITNDIPKMGYYSLS